MKRNFFLLVVLLMQLSVAAAFAISKKDAQSLVERQRYGEAIGVLQSLMQQSAYARDADCNKWMGQSLCLTGRYEESMPYLEYAVNQNRRSGALWYMSISLQHLYDFDGALEALDAYRPVLSSDYWLSRADSLEAMIRQGLRAMEHVQDVVVIDSLLVPRSTFFTYYKLGPESGRVCHGQEGLYFESQSEDYRIYAIDNHLYQSHRIQGEWQERDLLPGLGSTSFRVIDPFLRSDGETMYFACDSLPGMGGLDIYKTKFSAEDGVFYRPERLGMPFNSPFDDYMLAIDETHQVGWWATERRQYADSVIIYLFMIDDEPEYLDEASASLARLDNISETWRDPSGYSELMASIMTADQQVEEESSLKIIINDYKIYTHEEQFTTQQGLSAYRESVKLEGELAEIATELAALRDEYQKAGKGRRGQLTSQLQKLEYRHLILVDQYRKQVKLYRSLEQ